MSEAIYFVPASMDAFKRVSRDLQRAYPLTLQESQEILAKLYGHTDLHALQERMKTAPGVNARWERLGRHQQTMEFNKAHHQFIQLLGPAAKSFSYLNFGNLGIFEAPEERARVMRENTQVQQVIDGLAEPEPDASPSAYFDVMYQDEPIYLPSGRTRREAVLFLTPKGKIIQKAIEWLRAAIELGPTAKTFIDKAVRMQELYPSNPYVLENLLVEPWPGGAWICDDAEFEGRAVHPDKAVVLWPLAQRCRALFDEVLPRTFRGSVEPHLIGDGIANEPYLAVHYFGALCAATLGRHRDALAWARRSIALHKRDSYGARFLIEALTGSEE